MTIEEKRRVLKSICENNDCGNCPISIATIEMGYGTCRMLSNIDSDAWVESIYSKFHGIDTTDTVNHPAHYQGAHECIDIMEALFGREAVKAFCRCNAFKYRFRADKKNGAEDIKKAEWYENRPIEMGQEDK